MAGLTWEDDVAKVKGVGPKKVAAFARLGVSTVYDLLTFYPRGYIDQSHRTPFSELSAGEEATVLGRVLSVEERRTGRKMTILTARLGDGTGYLSMTWFNQPFLKKKLTVGRQVLATGKLTYAYRGQGALSMTSMQTFEIFDGETTMPTGLLPVYPATESLTQPFLRRVVAQALSDCPQVPEVLPPTVIARCALPARRDAFQDIHFPKTMGAMLAARRRLAFDELYLIQYGLLLLKKNAGEGERGVRHLMHGNLTENVYRSLPFSLTGDQETVWREITTDMEKPTPMRRLVQGDVGSGKTVIALLALVKTVENGWQGALMAPTEILARQHYDTFCALLKKTDIRIGFLSGRLTAREHREMTEKIASHDVDIVIGTHALIQDKVSYDALGLVVTDEQHRFGIAQRAKLTNKGNAGGDEWRTPDMLVMTATPIPRTMTLTVYGDLDVSRIASMPPGRRPIRTFVRGGTSRARIYDFVRKEILAGRQAYVVCPLIEGNDESSLASAEDIFVELSTGVFQGIRCGLVHGRMKTKEKDDVMQSFYAGDTKLLVATTVIEVGVNVPNATIMVVENADRFGLAQLHQLRGRIGRGSFQSYCILIAGNAAGTSERLSIMERTASGFELAEEDLRMRGPGQFFGAMQHGIGDLKIANVLRDTDILMQARRAAAQTLASTEENRYVREVLQLQYRERFERIMEA